MHQKFIGSPALQIFSPKEKNQRIWNAVSRDGLSKFIGTRMTK